MEFVTMLWMPILVGGLAVFIMSALVWTVMPHHKTEWTKLSNEDAVADAIRAGSPKPGLYSVPYCTDQAEMQTPEFKAKMERGPIVYMTVAPNGAPKMGPMMAKSFVWSVVIAFFIAYVTWNSVLAPGEQYLAVFRAVGTIGFMTYCMGACAESIWFGRPWRSFMLQAFDALLYGLVLGGVFGWLWP